MERGLRRKDQTKKNIKKKRKKERKKNGNFVGFVNNNITSLFTVLVETYG
jgi:hypothetical protein